MKHSTCKWGVAVYGSEEDQKVWSSTLRQPFDPHIIVHQDAIGKYFLLKKEDFEKCNLAIDVYNRARKTIKLLNDLMRIEYNTQDLNVGPVFDLTQKPYAKHAFGTATMEAIGSVHAVGIATSGAQQRIIPPTQPNVYFGLKAALRDHRLAAALGYIANGPSWIEIYKAYEALNGLPRGKITNAEVSLLAWSAQFERHHENKIRKPDAPMELSHARQIIKQWFWTATQQVLSGDP